MATTVKKWVTNNEIFGHAAVSKTPGGGVYAFDKKGAFIKLFIFAAPGVTYGMASTRGAQMSDGITYYLVTLKTPYKKGADLYEYAYVSYQDFYFSKVRAENEEAAKSDAQVLFNKLIESDKKLQLQIAAWYKLLAEADKRKINVTAQAKKLTEIADTLKRRQDAIRTNPAIKVVQTFKLSGIGCNCAQVGLLPIVWGLIIGGGAVLAGLTVYYFLKPEYNASQASSKYLEEHEAELRVLLGPEKYEEMKKVVDGEIQAEAKEAYSEGKSETTFGLIKNVAMMAAGFFLITKMQSTAKG